MARENEKNHMQLTPTVFVEMNGVVSMTRGNADKNFLFQRRISHLIHEGFSMLNYCSCHIVHYLIARIQICLNYFVLLNGWKLLSHNDKIGLSNWYFSEMGIFWSRVVCSQD